MTTRTANPRLALAAVVGVLFVTFLDTTVVSVTLGDVQSDLHAGVVPLQWVVNAYTLVFASLMLTAGTLGDRWGRKRVMLVGLAVFCGGSLIAALADSTAWLIAGRAVMGVGAAASEPGTLSVLRQLFPERAARARAIGVWAAVSGLALALGPVIGGLLVGAFDWRAVFWFNLIVGVLLLAAAWRTVPESADPEPGRLDLVGFVLGSTTLGCAIYGVIWGEQIGYGSGPVLALFAAAAAAAVVFTVVELRIRVPMVELRFLFGERIVRSALVVAFAVYFGVFSIFFFTALYLQEAVGYSGWRTAGVFGPMAAAIILGALASGAWTARSSGSSGVFEGESAMITGCVLAAAGLLATRHYLDPHPPFARLAGSLALAGLGFGLAVVPLTAAVMAGVPAARSGMAAAATNTMRQIGAVVGVAALGSMVDAHLNSDLIARLNVLGIPANFQSIVIDALETGGMPSGGDASSQAAYGPIVQKVIGAAFAAFHDGLEVALLVSALIILAAALLAAASSWRARPAHDSDPAPSTA
jgi:EmrB/QacA subfamily drug resistance transporter